MVHYVSKTMSKYGKMQGKLLKYHFNMKHFILCSKIPDPWQVRVFNSCVDIIS